MSFKFHDALKELKSIIKETGLILCGNQDLGSVVKRQ